MSNTGHADAVRSTVAELSTTRLSLRVWNVAEAIALPNTSFDQLSSV
nr:hypothetical protein [Rhizobium lusitanum]